VVGCGPVGQSPGEAAAWWAGRWQPGGPVGHRPGGQREGNGLLLVALGWQPACSFSVSWCD
jgi:hypothetical protein